MPTLYVTDSTEASWHILRRNERQLVWCPIKPDGPAWRHSSLRRPALVCDPCRDSETADRAADVGRVPGLGSAF